jgi:integrase
VADLHLLDLHRVIVEGSFQNRPEHVVSNAIKTWNRMREEIEGWPDITLSPLPPKRPRWTSPIESFPESFQGDVAAWIDRLENPDLLDATGPSKPLRPSTIAHRRFQIQETASALVLSGKPREEITELAILVDLENLKAALRWMMARFDGKPTEAIKGLAVGLQAIAAHHVQVGDDHLAEIKGIVKRLGRDAEGLREKNRQRLLQLEDPNNMAKLLHLPAALVSKSNKLAAQKPRRAALMLQAALAIEIELNTPMRVGNLASLNLERHLRPLGRGRKRTTHVHLPPAEVKNAKALDYEWGTDLTALLELYLAEARPVLLGQPSDYLFPAMDGGHKGSTHLSRLISDTIREHTGLEINAHLFRSIAGKIHSLVQPGDMATLSYVLNDSLKTVMKSYAQFERRAALEHYQQSVVEVRKTSGGKA